MKKQKRKTRNILLALLLIEIVVLIVFWSVIAVMWSVIAKAETMPSFSTEPKETQAKVFAGEETENVLATEEEQAIVNEATETQPTETVNDITCDDFPAFTLDYQEVENSYEVKEEDTWIVTLTEEEFKDFCMLVFAESGAEIEEGQVAVAATVINRMLSPKFPDTFYGVMNQPSQFSCVNNGYIYSSINEFEDLPETTINAVKRALKGEDPTEELLWNEAIKVGVEDQAQYASGGALYFYNPKKCGYRNCTVQVDIGNHTFTKVWRR